MFLAYLVADLTRLKLSFFSHDELVFNCTKPEDVATSVIEVLRADAADIQRILESELPDFAPFIRLEVFRLKRVVSDRSYYVKEIIDLVASTKDQVETVDVSFKCVSAAFFAQVFKKYYNLPITPEDRKVYFEGIVATLDTDIFNSPIEDVSDNE
jgi:hypothetical protein